MPTIDKAKRKRQSQRWYQKNKDKVLAKQKALRSFDAEEWAK